MKVTFSERTYNDGRFSGYVTIQQDNRLDECSFAGIECDEKTSDEELAKLIMAVQGIPVVEESSEDSK